jgi:hypothetical protein
MVWFLITHITKAYDGASKVLMQWKELRMFLKIKNVLQGITGENR